MTKTKFSIKRILFYFFVIIVLAFSGGLCAKAESVYTFSGGSVANTRINMQSIKGENTIVLPSAVKPDRLVLFGEFSNFADIFIKGDLKTEAFSSGMKINLEEFCSNSNYSLSFFDENETFAPFEVKFLFSENIPAVFLVSDNPEEGRKWVEEKTDKSNKATGTMVMQKSGGELVYNGKLTQIKGRGNSTWMQVKKPYQIKTASSVDLLQTGDSKNKSKTWLLLANYMDPSLLNNSIVLNMGKSLGIQSNVESTYVNLYYDGEYRGNYLLTEKVEIGDGRVSIENLEEKNEKANKGVDIESLPTKTGETKNGASYTYCDGLASPDDITGGYLLEMDYEVRAKEEICYFKTTRGQYVVVKSPEYASREEMEYISSLYQEYEDAVYNGGINPTTGKSYREYIDIDSLVNYYLINEFTKARDFFSSSAYLYKNAGEEKMYMGPLWDYDQSFMWGRFEEGQQEHPYGASIYNTEFGVKLLETEGFAELLESSYNERFFPLITEIISSSTTGDVVSLANEIEKIRASATINTMMWYSDLEWEKEVENLRTFIDKRMLSVKELLNKYTEVDDYENRFYDVLSVDWFYDAVSYVSSIGYINGVSEKCFDPYSNVRRSEIAQVLYNMDKGKKTYKEQSYSDVSVSDWFYNAVEWVSENKIMQGAENKMFRPKDYITREELITFLYRYKKEPKAESERISLFADAKEVSADAKDAVEWAVEKGIIIGDTNNLINPKTNLTRAEMATILSRFSKI